MTLRGCGCAVLALMHISTVGVAGPTRAQEQSFEIDFTQEPLSVLYPPAELTAPTEAVWVGTPIPGGCAFNSAPALSVNAGEMLVEQQYSPSRCEMMIAVGVPQDPAVFARYENLVTGTDGEVSSNSAASVTAAARYRAETISAYEEPARWFPCHGTGQSTDSELCQLALRIKPVNTVWSRLTYQPSGGCANGQLHTWDRDYIVSTQWYVRFDGNAQSWGCALAQGDYAVGFGNKVFCGSLITSLEAIDDMFDTLDVEFPDLDLGNPTLTWIKSMAGGRSDGSSYHNSQTSKSGACSERLRYTSVGVRVRL